MTERQVRDIKHQTVGDRLELLPKRDHFEMVNNVGKRISTQERVCQAINPHGYELVSTTVSNIKSNKKGRHWGLERRVRMGPCDLQWLDGLAENESRDRSV